MLSHIIVGAGYALSIARLAEIFSKVVGYHSQIESDNEQPDGTNVN